MKYLALTAALGATCLGLAACSDNTRNTADTAATEGNGTATAGSDGTGNGTATAGASAFPKGARIVEEGGVTYRVDPDGTRVRLTDTDSRIVVEGGNRFRVDPDGTRVRIDPEGVALDVDLPDIDTPDVDVGINKKGNPDIDVKDKSDGNDGPN